MKTILRTGMLTTSEKMWLHWSSSRQPGHYCFPVLPHLKRCGSIEARPVFWYLDTVPTLPHLKRCGSIEAINYFSGIYHPFDLPHLKRCGSIEALPGIRNYLADFFLTTSEKMWLHWSISHFIKRPGQHLLLTTSEKMWLHWSYRDLIKFICVISILPHLKRCGSIEAHPASIQLHTDKQPLTTSEKMWLHWSIVWLLVLLLPGERASYHIWKDVAPLKP